MSSASKGRYQSRLFNFFHKQSRRFGEGFGRSLRQLQVATSWSLETLSKSIYLLLQKAIDSAGTQLPAAAEQSKLHLQPLEASSDTAIVRVLENVADFSHDLENLSPNLSPARREALNSPPSPNDSKLSISPTTTDNKLTSSGGSSQKIRGIASQLYNQNLVLVTSENEILDVLTASQQQALENKIISEIANYWRSWRLSQVKQETNLLSKLLSRVERFSKRLSPDNNKTKALPPENAVVKREYKHLQINPTTLASLDTAVAKLETNALAPVSRVQIIVQQRGGEFIKVVQTKLNIFLYGDRQITVSTKQVLADGNLETQKSKIQALISAALSYFYGEPKGKKIKQTPPRRYLSSTKSKTSYSQSQQLKDDWLSLGDLFGSQLPQLNQRNQVSNKLQASKKQTNSSTEVNNSSEKLFGRFQIPNWRTLRLKEKAGLQKPQKSVLQSGQDGRTTNNKLTSTQTTSRNSQKITITPTSELQNRSREIAQTQTSESTQVEAKPEWIETKAELVGYQKHPLEQILAWIDGTMVKIEELFVKVAKALQQLWRK